MPEDNGYERIAAVLDREYGQGHSYWLSDPIEVLVATVLSQSTTDVNSKRCFLRLKADMPDWNRLADVECEYIESLIADAGLGVTRSRRLRDIARKIRCDFGEVSLDKMRGWDYKRIMDYLVSLPGVGPKTAACVALFAFGAPVVPVDVHVARVATRLGLITQSSTINQQTALAQVVPEGNMVDFHLQLIAHGRSICRPERPRCDQCALHDECDYALPDSDAAVRQ